MNIKENIILKSKVVFQSLNDIKMYPSIFLNTQDQTKEQDVTFYIIASGKKSIVFYFESLSARSSFFLFFGFLLFDFLQGVIFRLSSIYQLRHRQRSEEESQICNYN